MNFRNKSFFLAVVQQKNCLSSQEDKFAIFNHLFFVCFYIVAKYKTLKEDYQ